MNMKKNHRGGSPVGYQNELEDVESSAVLYLRLWCDGPEAQKDVYNDFSTVLGELLGKKSVNSLDKIWKLLADHGRRPLMRHDVECKCLGADEACFANLIRAAAEGQREDAMIFATLLVSPDFSAWVVALAQNFGLALKKICDYKYNSLALTNDLKPEGSRIH